MTEFPGKPSSSSYTTITDTLGGRQAAQIQQISAQLQQMAAFSDLTQVPPNLLEQLAQLMASYGYGVQSDGSLWFNEDHLSAENDTVRSFSEASKRIKAKKLNALLQRLKAAQAGSPQAREILASLQQELASTPAGTLSSGVVSASALQEAKAYAERFEQGDPTLVDGMPSEQFTEEDAKRLQNLPRFANKKTEQPTAQPTPIPPSGPPTPSR